MRLYKRRSAESREKSEQGPISELSRQQTGISGQTGLNAQEGAGGEDIPGSQAGISNQTGVDMLDGDDENEAAGAAAMGGGSAAFAAIKAELQERSGVDLSDVSIHTDSEKPGEIGAYAYTKGKDIYIAPGQEELAGHELTHAVQQKQGKVDADAMVGGEEANLSEELEKDADDLEVEQAPEVYTDADDAVIQGKFKMSNGQIVKEHFTAKFRFAIAQKFYKEISVFTKPLRNDVGLKRELTRLLDANTSYTQAAEELQAVVDNVVNSKVKEILDVLEKDNRIYTGQEAVKKLHAEIFREFMVKRTVAAHGGAAFRFGIKVIDDYLDKVAKPAYDEELAAAQPGSQPGQAPGTDAGKQPGGTGPVSGENTGAQPPEGSVDTSNTITTANISTNTNTDNTGSGSDNTVPDIIAKLDDEKDKTNPNHTVIEEPEVQILESDRTENAKGADGFLRPYEMTAGRIKLDRFNPGKNSTVGAVQREIDGAATVFDAFRILTKFAGDEVKDGEKGKDGKTPGDRLNEMDLPTMKSVFKNMARMIFDYPELKGTLGMMEAMESLRSKGTLMSTPTKFNHDDKRNIKINPSYYEDSDGAQVIRDEGEEKAKGMYSYFSVATYDYVGNHELGHILNTFLANADGLVKDNNERNSSAQSGMPLIEEAIKRSGDVQDMSVLRRNANDVYMPDKEDRVNLMETHEEWLKRQSRKPLYFPKGSLDVNDPRLHKREISTKYGFSSFPEFFAEAFADVYAHGDRARKTSIELVKLYDAKRKTDAMKEAMGLKEASGPVENPASGEVSGEQIPPVISGVPNVNGEAKGPEQIKQNEPVIKLSEPVVEQSQPSNPVAQPIVPVAEPVQPKVPVTGSAQQGEPVKKTVIHDAPDISTDTSALDTGALNTNILNRDNTIVTGANGSGNIIDGENANGGNNINIGENANGGDNTFGDWEILEKEELDLTPNLINKKTGKLYRPYDMPEVQLNNDKFNPGNIEAVAAVQKKIDDSKSVFEAYQHLQEFAGSKLTEDANNREYVDKLNSLHLHTMKQTYKHMARMVFDYPELAGMVGKMPAVFAGSYSMAAETMLRSREYKHNINANRWLFGTNPIAWVIRGICNLTQKLGMNKTTIAGIEYTGTHELGHLLNLYLVSGDENLGRQQDMDSGKNIIPLINKAIERSGAADMSKAEKFDSDGTHKQPRYNFQFLPDITASHVKGMYDLNKPELRKQEISSLYGLSHYAEFFAEAFADVYANGENARKTSREMVRLYDEERSKKNIRDVMMTFEQDQIGKRIQNDDRIREERAKRTAITAKDQKAIDELKKVLPAKDKYETMPPERKKKWTDNIVRKMLVGLQKGQNADDILTKYGLNDLNTAEAQEMLNNPALIDAIHTIGSTSHLFNEDTDRFKKFSSDVDAALKADGIPVPVVQPVQSGTENVQQPGASGSVIQPVQPEQIVPPQPEQVVQPQPENISTSTINTSTDNTNVNSSGANNISINNTNNTNVNNTGVNNTNTNTDNTNIISTSTHNNAPGGEMGEGVPGAEGGENGSGVPGAESGHSVEGGAGGEAEDNQPDVPILDSDRVPNATNRAYGSFLRPYEMTQGRLKLNRFNPGNVDILTDIQNRIDNATTVFEGLQILTEFAGEKVNDIYDEDNELTSENMALLDLGTMKNVFKTMARMVLDYPELVGTLGVMKLVMGGAESESTMMSTPRHYGREAKRELQVNTSFYGNTEKAAQNRAKRLKKSGEKHQSSGGIGVEYSANHELGHILNTFLSNAFADPENDEDKAALSRPLVELVNEAIMRSGDAGDLSNVPKYTFDTNQTLQFKSGKEKTVLRLKGMFDLQDPQLHKNEISTNYGFSDYAEFFAEAFKDVYVNGDNARKTSIELVKLYDEKRKDPRVKAVMMPKGAADVKKRIDATNDVIRKREDGTIQPLAPDGGIDELNRILPDQTTYESISNERREALSDGLVATIKGHIANGCSVDEIRAYYGLTNLASANTVRRMMNPVLRDALRKLAADETVPNHWLYGQLSDDMDQQLIINSMKMVTTTQAQNLTEYLKAGDDRRQMRSEYSSHPIAKSFFGDRNDHRSTAHEHIPEGGFSDEITDKKTTNHLRIARESARAMFKTFLMMQLGRMTQVDNGADGDTENSWGHTLADAFAHGGRTMVHLGGQSDPEHENGDTVADLMSSMFFMHSEIGKRSAATHHIVRDKDGKLVEKGGLMTAFGGGFDSQWHNFGMPLAIGGIGNKSTSTNVRENGNVDRKTIDIDNRNGHLYIGTLEGDSQHNGGMLIGMETTGPYRTNGFGRTHTMWAGGSKMKATGSTEAGIHGKKRGGRQLHLENVKNAELIKFMQNADKYFDSIWRGGPDGLEERGRGYDEVLRKLTGKVLSSDELKGLLKNTMHFGMEDEELDRLVGNARSSGESPAVEAPARVNPLEGKKLNDPKTETDLVNPETNRLYRPYEFSKEQIEDSTFNPGKASVVEQVQRDIDAQNSVYDAYQILAGFAGGTHKYSEAQIKALNALNLMYMKRVFKQMARMIYDYPELSGLVDEVAADYQMNSDKDIMATDADKDEGRVTGHTIYINNGMFSSSKKSGGFRRESDRTLLDKERDMHSAPLYYSANHEMGHLVNTFLRRAMDPKLKKGNNGDFDRSVIPYINEAIARSGLIKDVTKLPKYNEDGTHIGKAGETKHYEGMYDLSAEELNKKEVTSLYGRTQYAEFFAEAFADVYAHGKDAKKINIELLKLYDEHKNFYRNETSKAQNDEELKAIQTRIKDDPRNRLRHGMLTDEQIKLKEKFAKLNELRRQKEEGTYVTLEPKGGVAELHGLLGKCADANEIKQSADSLTEKIKEHIENLHTAEEIISYYDLGNLNSREGIRISKNPVMLETADRIAKYTEQTPDSLKRFEKLSEDIHKIAAEHADPHAFWLYDETPEDKFGSVQASENVPGFEGGNTIDLAERRRRMMTPEEVQAEQAEAEAGVKAAASGGPGFIARVCSSTASAGKKLVDKIGEYGGSIGTVLANTGKAVGSTVAGLAAAGTEKIKQLGSGALNLAKSGINNVSVLGSAAVDRVKKGVRLLFGQKSSGAPDGSPVVSESSGQGSTDGSSANQGDTTQIITTGTGQGDTSRIIVSTTGNVQGSTVQNGGPVSGTGPVTGPDISTSTQPPQPVTQPVQPVIQPVQPVIQPVQPVIQPVQPQPPVVDAHKAKVESICPEVKRGYLTAVAQFVRDALDNGSQQLINISEYMQNYLAESSSLVKVLEAVPYESIPEGIALVAELAFRDYGLTEAEISSTPLLKQFADSIRRPDLVDVTSIKDIVYNVGSGAHGVTDELYPSYGLEGFRAALSGDGNLPKPCAPGSGKFVDVTMQMQQGGASCFVAGAAALIRSFNGSNFSEDDLRDIYGVRKDPNKKTPLHNALGQERGFARVKRDVDSSIGSNINDIFPAINLATNGEAALAAKTWFKSKYKGKSSEDPARQGIRQVIEERLRKGQPLLMRYYAHGYTGLGHYVTIYALANDGSGVFIKDSVRSAHGDSDDANEYDRGIYRSWEWIEDKDSVTLNYLVNVNDPEYAAMKGAHVENNSVVPNETQEKRDQMNREMQAGCFEKGSFDLLPNLPQNANPHDMGNYDRFKHLDYADVYIGNGAGAPTSGDIFITPKKQQVIGQAPGGANGPNISGSRSIQSSQGSLGGTNTSGGLNTSGTSNGPKISDTSGGPNTSNESNVPNTSNESGSFLSKLFGRFKKKSA